MSERRIILSLQKKIFYALKITNNVGANDPYAYKMDGM